MRPGSRANRATLAAWSTGATGPLTAVGATLAHIAPTPAHLLAGLGCVLAASLLTGSVLDLYAAHATRGAR
jgi:hypothetical protein